MGMRESIHFNRQKDQEQPKVFPGPSKVNLNILMEKLKEEEKKIKRNNFAISLAAFSAVAVFGIILTL